MRAVSPVRLSALLALLACGCSPAFRSDSVPGDVIAAHALRDADSLSVTPTARGVHHVRAWFRQGPWAIHVLEVDTARCAPLWEARKPEGRLDARALTSTLTGTAPAGINADFFQLPGGTPVGAQVRNGVPLIGPSGRAAWLWDGRAMFAGFATLHGAVRAGTDSALLVQVNRPATRTSAYAPPTDGAALFTERAGRIVPHADASVVFVRVLGGDEREGNGTVVRVSDVASDTIPLTAGEAAIQLYGATREWAKRRAAGEAVAWRAAVLAEGDGRLTAKEAVGGFPLLLQDGRDVLAETEVNRSFGVQRHPRSAIGWSSTAGRVFLVLVDGRQAPYSDGMSLGELTWVFQRLGATHALNLDGGGSSALVVGGRIVNRPSDTQGERSVGNALVLAGCR